MNEDELIDSLRRTLHSRAAAVKPKSAPARPEPAPIKQPGPRRPDLLRRPWVLAGLGIAAAGIAAVSVTLGLSQPKRASITTENSGTTLFTPSTAPAVTSPPTTSEVTTTPTTVPLAPVPANFAPASATFVSPRSGWALGTVPCGSSLCASLARTSDSGRHWGSVAAPRLTFSNEQSVADTWVRFVNLDDGWIMTPVGNSGATEVFYTSDGGETWQTGATPGGPTATVLALEAGDDLVHAVVTVPGTPDDSVFSSPLDHIDWKQTGTVPRSGGPVPTAEIALYGGSGWIISDDRTTSGGATLGTDGNWTSWSPPCLTANGTGLVAASSTRDVSVVCDEGIWGPSSQNLQGEWLFSSTDGGRTFSKVAAVTGQVTSLTAAAGNPLTLVAATNTGLEASFDGGKNWQTVYSASGQVDQTFVGFTTGTQGLATLQAANGSSTMLMTYDGGHSWTAVAF